MVKKKKAKRYTVLYGTATLLTKKDALKEAARMASLNANNQYNTAGYYIFEVKTLVAAKKLPKPPKPKIIVKEL